MQTVTNRLSVKHAPYSSVFMKAASLLHSRIEVQNSLEEHHDVFFNTMYKKFKSIFSEKCAMPFFQSAVCICSTLWSVILSIFSTLWRCFLSWNQCVPSSPCLSQQVAFSAACNVQQNVGLRVSLVCFGCSSSALSRWMAVTPTG